MGDIDIQYAAHTATCTFLLDGDGICRRVVMNPEGGRVRDAGRSASRAVGAQYVASLDPSLSGFLAEMPKVGTAMLFARTDERGRISLVRTGQVTRFERYIEDPFAVSEDRPSVVATSAPPLSPSTIPTPRRSFAIPPPPADPYMAEGEPVDDRTRPLEAFQRIRTVPPPPPSEQPATVRTPPPPPARMRSDVVPKLDAPARPPIRRRG